MDTRKNPFFEFPAPSDRDSDCSSYLLPVFIHTSSKKHSFPKALPAHIWVSFGLNRAWKNFEMKKIAHAHRYSGRVCESLGFWRTLGRLHELLPGQKWSVLSSLPLALSAFIHVFLSFQSLHK